MRSKYGKFLGICATIYIALHFVITVKNNRTVEEHREKTNDNDGPLVMKDSEKTNKNVIRGVVVVNANDAFLSDREDVKIEDSQNMTYELPVISMAFKKVFKKKVKKVQKRTPDFLLFTLVNKAYQNLTINWLCNVDIFETNIIAKTLIVSLDSDTCELLHNQWPDVECVVFNVTDEYNQPLNWGHQNYINILTLRIQLMNLLVDMNVTYILFETDASWLRDPISFFKNQTLIDDADIVVPRKGYSEKGQTYTFDPMIVYPTDGAKMLLKEMETRLTADSKLFDQDLLDDLCRVQYNGVICRQFEWNDVADGKWFKLTDSERDSIRPYIVNNNYYVGVTNKASRQALNSLWFLSPKGYCMMSKVKNMLKKYSTISLEKKTKYQKSEEHRDTKQ